MEDQAQLVGAVARCNGLTQKVNIGVSCTLFDQVFGFGAFPKTWQNILLAG